MPEEHLGFEVDSESATYGHETAEERIDPNFGAKMGVGMECVRCIVERQWSWNEKWESLSKGTGTGTIVYWAWRAWLEDGNFQAGGVDSCLSKVTEVTSTT
ncbi:hypothetical protein G7Y79_00008g024460 [Physcia stellaris]|nr:hypothetical protein G7Y79_00008g024460 [Physcia stellaris]